jgi:hypothetical protein
MGDKTTDDAQGDAKHPTLDPNTRAASGLDASGQMRFGDAYTLALRGGNIEIYRAGQPAPVTLNENDWRVALDRIYDEQNA